MSARPAAVASILGAAVLFGSTGTAQALGPDGSTPVGVGAVRILVGAATLWVLAGRAPGFGLLRRHGRLVVLGAAGVAAYQPGFFTGTDRLGVALGTVVALASGPLFAGLVEWGAGRPPEREWFVGTAFATCGGALLVFAGDGGARFDVVGLVGALTAGAGYAVYAVVTRRLIGRGVDSTEASAWQFTLGALALLPFLVGQPLDWLVTPSGVAMALHLGVLTTGVAYLLYGWGLRSVEPSTATTLTLAEPATAAVLAVVVLDERLRWFGWVGFLLVVAGLVAVGAGGRRRWSRTLAPT